MLLLCICIWAKNIDIFIAIYTKPGARQLYQMYLIVQFLFKLQHQCRRVKQTMNWYELSLADIVGIHVRNSSLSIDHGYTSREKRVN